MLRIQHLITLSQSLLAPHLALLASPSLAFDPSTFTARSAFLSRQVKLLQQSLRWRRFARSLRIPASAEGVGAGLLFDELLERELVAKVILPLVEASWATGGEEMGAKVSNESPPNTSAEADLTRSLCTGHRYAAEGWQSSVEEEIGGYSRVVVS